jgi:plasmid stabilization system protein ParE
MRTRWLPSALQDLEGIHEYLSSNHPSYAISTVREIYEAIRSLNKMPYRGRPSSQHGIRVMPLPKLPYLVYYRINDRTIELLYIRHGAREGPILDVE